MRARPIDNLASGFRKILWLLVLVLLLSYFFSMVLGLFLVFVPPQGTETASQRVVALPLSMFMIVNFSVPLGISVGMFFTVLWLLYVGAFLLAWFDKPHFASSPRDLRVGGLDMARSNYLTVLPQLAPVVLVAVILIQSLQESAGVPTGGLPPEPPVLQFLLVSYAPLVEEFSYRITTIGFLDGLSLLVRTPQHRLGKRGLGVARILLLTMWKPESTKELMGLPTVQSHGMTRGILRFEWMLLVVSSVAFGAVHYLAGGGWDIGKISTAALSGLAMGLVYLRYGAYAPILLHWFFNYYLGAYDLASQLGLAGFGSLSGGVEFLNVGVGALLIPVLAGLSLEKIRRLDIGRMGKGSEYVEEPANAS